MTLDDLKKQLDQLNVLQEPPFTKESLAEALQKFPREVQELFLSKAVEGLPLALSMRDVLKIVIQMKEALDTAQHERAEALARLQWIAEELSKERIPEPPQVYITWGRQAYVDVGKFQVASRIREALTSPHPPPHGPIQLRK